MHYWPDRVTEACCTNRSFAIAYNPELLLPSSLLKAGMKSGRRKKADPGLI